MWICGINPSHTASAALFQDGCLVSALQEERPTRQKNRSGFPERAIQVLLEAQGLDWREVDAYVFGGLETYTEEGLREGDRSARIRSFKGALRPMGRLRRLLRQTPLRARVQRQRREAQVRMLAARGVDPARAFSVEHHRCHAATAYFGRGADPEALVITLDGAGDGLCATVSIPEGAGRLARLATVSERHSIGNLWEVITALMGMVPLEHEYKLMGMAPYASGERVEQARRIFASGYRALDGVWELAPGVPSAHDAYAFWRDRLEFVRFDHVCAGLQAFTEAFIVEWVRGWLRKTGRRRLRLSGGVFMNVKLNKLIGELPEVDDLFVFPSCGDETNALGAAWAFMADRGMVPDLEPLRTLYLGPDLTREACADAAARAAAQGWLVTEPADVEEAVADLLVRGEVVARASGREEFGARSLGNRAILADPTRPDVVKVVNRAIKSRDFWMPFAPSVMAECAGDYLHNPKGLDAPYMILAFDSRNTDLVKAACHPEDGTIRPQVVHKEANPGYHRLLSCFRERTGRGAILNTSFNIHGEPIVSTAADALDVMARSGLVHLALGPYLIHKA